MYGKASQTRSSLVETLIHPLQLKPTHQFPEIAKSPLINVAGRRRALLLQSQSYLPSFLRYLPAARDFPPLSPFLPPPLSGITLASISTQPKKLLSEEEN